MWEEAIPVAGQSWRPALQPGQLGLAGEKVGGRGGDKNSNVTFTGGTSAERRVSMRR